MPDELGTISYCRWEVRGQRIDVKLSLAIVQQLGIAIRESTESRTGRRAEIGGFLLGATTRVHSTTVVEVHGFEIVECEHAFGASYLLSPDDRRRFSERLRRRRHESNVVGFFRSNTRREFAPATEDLPVMTGYFSKPWMPLLLIHTRGDETLTGGFCFVEQRVNVEGPCIEFPFDVDLLRAGHYEICDNGVTTTPAFQAAGRRLLLAGPTRVLHWWLRLRTRIGGNRAVVTKKLASLTSGASSCLLPTVRHFRREWILLATTFATALFGSVLYHVKHPTDATAAVVGEPRRRVDPPVVRATAPQAVVLRATDVPFQNQRVTAVAPVPRVSARKRAAPVRRQRAARRIVTASRTTVWTAPESVVAPLAPPLPPAPDIATVPVVSPGAREILANAMPARPDPFVSISIDTLPPGRRNVIRRIFSSRNAARDGFVPPHVLSERWPAIPPEMRATLRGSVPVSVKLYLDRAGRVDYAELMSDGTGSMRDFATLAVFASRKWQFSPAHDNVGPVPAEVIIRFRFGSQTDGGTREEWAVGAGR